MLKHQFFINFSAVPLSSFFALAKGLSAPVPEGTIAFIKKIAKKLDVIPALRKVKSA